MFKLLASMAAIAFHRSALLYWAALEDAQRVTLGEVDADISEAVRRHQIGLQVAKADFDEVSL